MSAERASPPAPHWALVLLAAIGLLGVIAIVIVVLVAVGPGQRPERARVAGPRSEAEFAIGNVQDLTGTNLMHVAITRSGRGRSGSYSGDHDTYNILLLDKGSGDSRRILPDNRRRIRDVRYLSAEGDHLVPYERSGGHGEAEGDEANAVAFYVVSVERPGSPDVEDVLVGRLADGAQAYVMRGVDGIDARWMDSPTRIGFIVRERLGLYYRIVDTVALRVVRSRRIAIE